MRKRDLTFDKQFLGNTILQYKNQKIGMDENILMALADRYDDMLTRHSKLFVMRFDVHMPDGTDTADNSKFSEFQAHFIKKEKRAGVDPSYVAVREESDQKGVHYHETLLLNGNVTDCIYRHIQNANEAFNSAFQLPAGTRSGMINDCTKDRNGERQKNGVLIERNGTCGKQSENDSFRHASYLAKDSQKDPAKGVRELFASRIHRPQKGTRSEPDQQQDV